MASVADFAQGDMLDYKVRDPVTKTGMWVRRRMLEGEDFAAAVQAVASIYQNFRTDRDMRTKQEIEQNEQTDALTDNSQDDPAGQPDVAKSGKYDVIVEDVDKNLQVQLTGQDAANEGAALLLLLADPASLVVEQVPAG